MKKWVPFPISLLVILLFLFSYQNCALDLSLNNKYYQNQLESEVDLDEQSPESQETSESKSIAATEVISLLTQENPIIFISNQVISPEITKNKKFVLGYKNNQVHLKIGYSRETHIFSNSESILRQDGLINIFANTYKLVKRENEICLVRDNLCYARYTRSLFDDQIDKELYYRILDGVISELIEAPKFTRPPLCIIDGVNVEQHFWAYRQIGFILYRSSSLLNLIPFAEDHDRFFDTMKEAVQFLRANYTDFLNTAYYKCNKLTEMMTPYLVARGLTAYNRFAKEESLKTYIEGMIIAADQSDHANSVKDAATRAPDQLSKVFANAQAQYIGLQLIKAEISNEPLSPLIDRVFLNILKSQALSTSRLNSSYIYNQNTCIYEGDSNPTRSLTFGGWPHSVHLNSGHGDCRQSMGYHSLTINPLLDLYIYLQTTNLCTSAEFPFICSQLKWSLRAATAYFANENVFDSDSGMFYGHARFSVSEDYFATGNNFGGTSQYYVFFINKFLPYIDWIDTPADFTGQRVGKQKLLEIEKSSREYLLGQSRNYHSFLASWLISQQ